MAQGVAEIIRTAVTAAAVGGGAELPSGRAAPRVVGLIAETRTDHQVLILGDLPLQTGVEPVVVALRVGIAVGHQRIETHRSLVPLFHRRTVLGIGVVEEIAALERHLVALAPRVGVVDADGVDRRHAALRTHHVLAHAAAASAASAARNAQNVLEREILLVDVVEQPDERNAAVAAEYVGIAAGDVFEFVLGLGVGIVSESGVELAELPLPHTRTGDDVERLVALAVVHARKFGRVGEFVIDLHAIDGLGRKRFDGRGDILAEELFAIDEDLLDRFALRLDRTVGDGDAGHFFQQSFDIGVGDDLERSGVIAHRIAFLRGAQRLGLLDDRLDLHARFEFQHAEVEFRGRNPERRVKVVVADERYRKFVFSVSERRHGNRAFECRGEALLLLRGLDG